MCADYVPKYVTEADLRGFFTPPLDYDDITRNELLRKIEAVEDFVEATYFNDSTTTSAKARLPCLLLIASKIILSPELAKKYYTLNAETLGDYSYELAQPISRGTDIQSSPYVISLTWERMGIKMLEKRTTLGKWKVYRSND
jgi:hypothetical protein